MKKLLMIISLVFLLALVGPSATYAVGLEFAVGVWEQSPAGQLSFEELSELDILDLEDDLNYDDETRIFARLKIDMPAVIPNIYLMATPMEFDGTGQKNFNFGGTEFDGNFFSELTLDHLDLALYYGLPFVETATAEMFNIEVGINVRIYDFEGTIVGEEAITGVTVEESESFTLPIPMVYLAAQLRPLEKLAIEAEARGVIFGDDKVYSLIGRLKWKFLKPFFIAGGYRYDKIDIEEDDFTLDIDFSGLFAEAGVVF